MSTVYNEKGFKDRQDYLEFLADEYDTEFVYALAEILGPTEDFDGLVTSLQDHFQ